MSRPDQVARSTKARETSYQFPDKPLPHGIQFIFLDYDYNKFVNSINAAGEATSTNPKDPQAIKKLGFVPDANVVPEVKNWSSVVLPFPRTLSDQNNINNQSFERDFLFERLTSTLAGAGNLEGLSETLGQTVKDILSGIRGLTSGEGTAAGVIAKVLDGEKDIFGDVALASQYLAKTFLPGDLQKQAAVAAGAIVNPQQTLAFTGVELKNYSFTWDLFPSNKNDSEKIKQIVRHLKHKALPGVGSVENVTGLNRAYLKYPSVVRVNLLGIDESHFVRFKPAMLTNVTVDYGTGGQVTILKGGKPAAITLTLSFTELNIHTSEDYPEPSAETTNSSEKSPAG